MVEVSLHNLIFYWTLLCGSSMHIEMSGIFTASRRAPCIRRWWHHPAKHDVAILYRNPTILNKQLTGEKQVLFVNIPFLRCTLAWSIWRAPYPRTILSSLDRSIQMNCSPIELLNHDQRSCINELAPSTCSSNHITCTRTGINLKSILSHTSS